MKRLGLGVDQMADLLATKSGLAGLSGTSGDMRDLEEAAATGSSRARLAIDMFAHSIRHYVGAFLVELGGLDVLTFSGGIGENSTELRAAVCAGLSEFGIELDAGRNRAMRGEGIISAEGSRVRVMVIPADEERIAARQTLGDGGLADAGFADEERIVARAAVSLVGSPKSKSAKVVQRPPCPTES